MYVLQRIFRHDALIVASIGLWIPAAGIDRGDNDPCRIEVSVWDAWLLMGISGDLSAICINILESSK
jgi:hypothetical protein